VKSLVLLSLVVGLFVGGLLLAHPESQEIMRGDYEFDQWMFVPVSSKTWLLVLLLGIIGGCTGFLFYKFYKGRSNDKKEEETTTEGLHSGNEGG